MNDKKQIEEMCKDFKCCVSCEMFNGYVNDNDQLTEASCCEHDSSYCTKCYISTKQAKILINAGYRKIDKDSVVLTKKQYENLGLTLETIQEYETTNGQTHLIKERKTLKKVPPDDTTLMIYGELLKQTNKVEMYQRLLDEMGDKLEQIRKETAEKFAREIIKEFSESVYRPDGTGEKITDWADLHESDVWKIAEQFGVNLGELTNTRYETAKISQKNN